MSTKTIQKYQDFAALNKETYNFMSSMGLLKRNEMISKNRILITLESEESYHDPQLTHMSNVLRNFIKKHITNNNEELTELVNEKIGGVKSEMKSMQTAMTADMSFIKD
jgi:hypothetical protein